MIEKVYFKSLILVHEYWTILAFCQGLTFDLCVSTRLMRWWKLSMVIEVRVVSPEATGSINWLTMMSLLTSSLPTKTSNGPSIVIYGRTLWSVMRGSLICFSVIVFFDWHSRSEQRKMCMFKDSAKPLAPLVKDSLRSSFASSGLTRLRRSWLISHGPC